MVAFSITNSRDEVDLSCRRERPEEQFAPGVVGEHRPDQPLRTAQAIEIPRIEVLVHRNAHLLAELLLERVRELRAAIESAEERIADLEARLAEATGERDDLFDELEEIADAGEPTPIPNSPASVTGVMDLRGRTTALVDPKQLFGIEEPGPGDRILVFDPAELAGGQPLGWTVDDVHEVISVDPTAVEDAPGTARVETITGRGHPDLTFEGGTSLVGRTSEYVDGRTVTVGADKAAGDLDRELVEALADGADLTLTLSVER
jgi:hypothetical protein